MLSGLIWQMPAYAQNEQQSKPKDFSEEQVPAPPPPLPPKVLTGEQFEPKVNIRTDDRGQKFEEFRNNGVLVMVKVTPKKGPVYFLIDTDGDGDLETKQEDVEPGIRPVYWKLFEWK